MTETKWTPGPWQASLDNIRGNAWYQDIDGAIGQPDEHIGLAKVVVVIDGEDYRQGRANAHLIAAAPDLYEALSNFLENEKFQVGVGGNPNAVEKMLAQARAAIAKARGEP